MSLLDYILLCIYRKFESEEMDVSNIQKYIKHLNTLYDFQ